MGASVYVCMLGCMDANMYVCITHVFFKSTHSESQCHDVQMDIVALRNAYLHVVSGEGCGDPFVRVLHRFAQSATFTIM